MKQNVVERRNINQKYGVFFGLRGAWLATEDTEYLQSVQYHSEKRLTKCSFDELRYLDRVRYLDKMLF